MPDAAAAAHWGALEPPERHLLLGSWAPYTTATAASHLWEPHLSKPGMRPSALGRRVAVHGRRVRHLKPRG